MYFIVEHHSVDRILLMSARDGPGASIICIQGRQEANCQQVARGNDHDDREDELNDGSQELVSSDEEPKMASSWRYEAATIAPTTPTIVVPQEGFSWPHATAMIAPTSILECDESSGEVDDELNDINDADPSQQEY